MSPKAKKALAALIVCAVSATLAAYAPGVSCELEPETVEDLLPDAGSSESGGSESSSSG